MTAKNQTRNLARRRLERFPGRFYISATQAAQGFAIIPTTAGSARAITPEA